MNEKDAKSNCYDDIYDEFFNHMDHGECQELISKLFHISKASRDAEGRLIGDLDKYFDMRMLLITEAEKTAKFNIDNKDDWQMYLDDQGLSR